ncbi:MAG TPA: biosynthetic arginine decarboxylase [Opitutales bacterium]|nr:biosynthetic arginine decarboxylase [Opitutales bacterium]
MWRDPEKISRWTVADAAELYGVNRWGGDYFSVSEKGDVVVTPLGKGSSTKISLFDIAKKVQERGMAMPVIIRIENILGGQIKLLNETFRSVIKQIGYKGEFRGVYPIKVNQQEQVVDAISEFGRKYNHGLEAGSKPELIAAISLMKSREACLICNGYKDEEFIDLGLYAVKMGFKCFFVIEVPGEADSIIERAKKLGVRPLLGLRIRLSTQADGQWAESGGEGSVFGLNMSQAVEVIDRLKKEDMLDCLKLLHYHIGSQIPNIADIRAGAMEASRIYEELVKEGAEMGYLDLGGGLAVDYDGSNTNEQSSRNYTIEEYCYDVVESIMSVLDKNKVPHPTIITESGRVTVAYYSMLLFNILDVSSFVPSPIPEKLPKVADDLFGNLMSTFDLVSAKTLQECCNDALYYRNQALQLFKHGNISLRERAIAETIVRHIIIKISKIAATLKQVPKDVAAVDAQLCDIYYGNFSLFQSLPDMWAINQIFPVMPIHRLAEAPTHPAIISDITCDCDGKIDNFPSGSSQSSRTLLLHDLKDKEEYFLGVFLVGAYQETLGDLHNLFGDTNVVSIHVNDDGSYQFVRDVEGDSVSDVLTYVEYDVKGIRQRIKQMAEDAIEAGYMANGDRKAIMDAFAEGLRGYTYFEREW